MNKTLYFSYGSNMAIDRMLSRCPGCEPLCRADLTGWAIEFRRVLTIVRRPESVVKGALYRINGYHEKALDRYEGWPTYYDKEYLVVETDKGPVEAMVYILNKERPALPDRYYLQVCIEGCLDWGIPRQYMIQAVKELIA